MRFLASWLVFTDTIYRNRYFSFLTVVPKYPWWVNCKKREREKRDKDRDREKYCLCFSLNPGDWEIGILSFIVRIFIRYFNSSISLDKAQLFEFFLSNPWSISPTSWQVHDANLFVLKWSIRWVMNDVLAQMFVTCGKHGFTYLIHKNVPTKSC